jgi:hypothetical protein
MAKQEAWSQEVRNTRSWTVRRCIGLDAEWSHFPVACSVFLGKT